MDFTALISSLHRVSVRILAEVKRDGDSQLPGGFVVIQVYGDGGEGRSGYINNGIFNDPSMSNGERNGNGQVKITPLN